MTMNNIPGFIVQLTRERDEARAERDALAHVIEQARILVETMSSNGFVPLESWWRKRILNVLDTAPAVSLAVSLALHDAEVWEQGADAAAENVENGGGELVNPYRAAAIREESK